ncbi:hypothetical protein KEM54_001350 [Ascosphaera aggregata]|nr:hypothetical protein KEM54_001350 [Ascosphaera aggregata]
MSTAAGPLYLGFDLSTQQLKGVVVTSNLKVVHVAKFDFDADNKGYDVKKGVITNDAEHEVFAPVAMWMQALDSVLAQLREQGMDFQKLVGISGAGQQHGSVYWNHDAENILRSLDPKRTLEEQIAKALSHPFAPNWQDASTPFECEKFDACLGGPEALAQSTGSKAHHRFTGPQIMRFHGKYPEKYSNTSRISLVSSFLASIFLGSIAPMDISDVCGMDLWDIPNHCWNEKLLALAAGSHGLDDLKAKLGDVPLDGGAHLGKVHPYFVEKYGFNPDCIVTPFTGDNPATICALPLRPLDVMVSLGTSTTFLMSTPQYKPDPSTHFFNHPTTPGLYMFMLCYKNGALSREHIRDAINAKEPILEGESVWANYDKHVLAAPVCGQKEETDPIKLGLYFNRHEIVPSLRRGEWHFNYDPAKDTITETKEGWNIPYDDARAIVESQMLSCRLRSRALVHSPSEGVPPQALRVYLVGGGSRNRAIAKVAGQVLGGVEGVYKLDIGENACALGAAYKAVWAMERKPGQAFHDLIGPRWKEEDFIQPYAQGYQKGTFEKYDVALRGFEMMEKELLRRHAEVKRKEAEERERLAKARKA